MPSAAEITVTPEHAKTVADAGVTAFRVSNGLIKMSLAGVEGDAWTATTHEGGNHILWTIGHLAASHSHFAKMAGGTYTPDAAFCELFTKGSSPSADAGDFPSPAEVVGEYEKVCAAFIDAWSTVDPETITARPDGMFGQMFPATAYMGNFAAMHEMTHAGQILMVRRMLGMPRVIG